jgi:general secretion pathway protein H
MPISVTGNSRPAAGFTLVEIMVVLVIIGLAAAMAVLTLPGSDDALRRDADRLAARIVAARDHAIVMNRETALVLESGGYRFDERLDGNWRALSGPGLMPARWSEGTAATVVGGTRIGFDAVGLAAPATVVLSNDGGEARIEVTASGEVNRDAR